MKKRILIPLAIVITLTLTSFAYADNKLKVHGGHSGNLIFDGVVGCDVGDVVPKMSFVGSGGEDIVGTLSYPDWDSSKEGVFEFTWTFTPNNTEYEVRSGTFKVNIKPPRNDDAMEEPTTPSLTATTVLLDTMTVYDINLNDKVSGSSYVWTSSDTEIVEVNPANGKLKAIKEGKTNVTCEITFPDTTTQTLVSEVTVGYDENAPVLTEAVLDLNTGDYFDINLENKVTKSKYRWVSSDRGIVTVNSANGKVTAIGAGTAYVTCTITTPENQVIVLRCDINVTAPAIVTE